MNEHLNDPELEYARKALSALRQASLGQAAPEHVETTLLQAFRAEHRPQARANGSRRSAWIVGAIAASLAVAAAVRLSKPTIVNAPTPPVVAKAPAPPPKVAEVRPSVPNEPNPKAPRVRSPKPRPRPDPPVISASAPARREVTTDFFAIPYAPAMTQADYGHVIRVSMPATSMRTFGLPVREERMFDRVQADVLMGEDGIARAIRFVRQQNSGLNYR